MIIGVGFQAEFVTPIQLLNRRIAIVGRTAKAPALGCSADCRLKRNMKSSARLSGTLSNVSAKTSCANGRSALVSLTTLWRFAIACTGQQEVRYGESERPGASSIGLLN